MTLFYFMTIIHLSYCANNVGIISKARMRTDPRIEFFTLMNNSMMEITLVGPADRWFGIGIGNKSMHGTYAYIVSDEGVLTERILGNHNSGVSLPTEETDLNYTQKAVNGIREVFITRNRVGYSNLFYTYPNRYTPNVGLIAAWAIGPGDPFGNFHGDDNYLQDETTFLLTNETTNDPTLAPTIAPTDAPTLNPTLAPSVAPTNAPSIAPTPAPTVPFESRYDLFGTRTIGGDQEDNIELVIGIEAETKTVFINMTGPTSQWFAIGFGSGSKMENKYAIIIDWVIGREAEKFIIEDETILEYYLGDHSIGEPLTKFVEKKIQFDSGGDFRRNVLMERPAFKIDDIDGQYFNFSICNKNYDIIWARGEYDAREEQYFGSAHTSSNRGSGSIRVEGDDFENCNDTKSIFNTINWKLIIVVICIMINNVFY